MIVPLFILASLLATCHGADYQTFPLRMKTDLGIHYPPEVSCNSKMLAVEAYNLRYFKTVPQKCQKYVGDYMFSEQYQSDSKTVCVQAYYHAKSLAIKENDIWVFGIDDTVLSSVPYHSKVDGFGVEPFNSTKWHAWVALGVAPALPETLKLYGKLLELKVKIVFVTTRRHKYREVTEANLKRAGFNTWEKLITRGSEYNHVTKQEYKEAVRQKLENEGYRIIGNIGDQWSDLLGESSGRRTFKLPNPMYFVE